MSNEATVVFTAKSIDSILAEGGTSSWRLDRSRARQYPFVICTRNANAAGSEGPEAHHSAFLIGKVKEVVPASNRPEGRFLILLSEYAKVNIPNAWKGDRNPVRYAKLEDFNIDPSTLKWEPMPEPTRAQITPITPRETTKIQGLTMDEAKRGLAFTFGVKPESIEITIRG